MDNSNNPIQGLPTEKIRGTEFDRFYGIKPEHRIVTSCTNCGQRFYIRESLAGYSVQACGTTCASILGM